MIWIYLYNIDILLFEYFFPYPETSWHTFEQCCPQWWSRSDVLAGREIIKRYSLLFRQPLSFDIEINIIWKFSVSKNGIMNHNVIQDIVFIDHANANNFGMAIWCQSCLSQFLKRVQGDGKYSKDIFCINFRYKGWIRTIWSWSCLKMLWINLA